MDLRLPLRVICNLRPHCNRGATHVAVLLAAAIEQDDAAMSVLYYMATTTTTHVDENSSCTDLLPNKNVVIPRIRAHQDIFSLVPRHEYKWNTAQLVLLLFLNTKQAVANDATTTATTTTTSARAHVASNRKHERVQGPHRRRSNRVGRLATFLKILWNHTHDDSSSAGASSSLLFEDTTPLEFQSLLQDLFVLTPKVNDLLFEDDDADE
jgi:hypothetical protein